MEENLLSPLYQTALLIIFKSPSQTSCTLSIENLTCDSLIATTDIHKTMFICQVVILSSIRSVAICSMNSFSFTTLKIVVAH